MEQVFEELGLYKDVSDIIIDYKQQLEDTDEEEHYRSNLLLFSNTLYLVGRKYKLTSLKIGLCRRWMKKHCPDHPHYGVGEKEMMSDEMSEVLQDMAIYEKNTVKVLKEIFRDTVPLIEPLQEYSKTKYEMFY